MTLSRRGVLSGLVAAAVAAVAGLGIIQADPASARSSDDCCCIVQDGQLICTITGEELDECCCR